MLPRGMYVPHGSPDVVGEHIFGVDQEHEPHNFANPYKWRWVCFCGITDKRVHGKWQWQSPLCCYPSWLKHTERIK